jgi:hypothetical protein
MRFMPAGTITTPQGGLFYSRNARGIQAWSLGIGVYFHVPGNCHVLEEVLTAKSHKSKKFLRSGPFFLLLLLL